MALNLDVRDLRFAYPGSRAVLDGVSFGLERGDILCLLGPNGAGKTTLLRCLLGLERVPAGSVRVGDRDLREYAPRELARVLAFVPQLASMTFPFEAEEVVLMGRTPHLASLATPGAGDRAVARAAMARLGVEHLATRPFPELSAGERQMVRLARALAQESRILVLDEPCAGLDYANQATILRTLRGLAADGYSILLSSHAPEHAFLLHGTVALLKHGRLRGPGPARDIVTAAALGELYGVPMRVVTVPAPAGDSMALCLPSDGEARDAARAIWTPLDPDPPAGELARPGRRR